MSRPSQPRRGRGRPRRQYRILVVGERREHPDYDKLARALLEHAAMQAREAAENDPEVAPTGPDGTATKPDDPEARS